MKTVTTMGDVVLPYTKEVVVNELAKKINEASRELAEQIISKYKVSLTQVGDDEKYLVISFTLGDKLKD